MQNSLRQAFERWGLPARLRMDNGHPWGSAGDLPTELALWLVGLGIEMVWNPPARPQDNGVVERSQGVGKNWGEPRTCATFRVLQRRMDRFDRLQRERYPAVGSLSRWQAHPGLSKPVRRYRRRGERRIWSWNRVAEHLGDYAVPRKVDAKGAVSLYNRQRYVGVAFAGRYVVVTYDAVEQEWEFWNVEGQLLRRQPAPELSAARILALDVLRHGLTRTSKSRQNHVAK